MGAGEVEVQVDRSRRILRIVVSGPLTEALAVQASTALRSAPEFPSGFRVLIDLFGITKVEISSQTVQRFAEAAQADKNRFAFLTNQAATYSLAKLYEILSDLDQDRVSVFQDEVSAIDWLLPE